MFATTVLLAAVVRSGWRLGQSPVRGSGGSTDTRGLHSASPAAAAQAAPPPSQAVNRRWPIDGESTSAAMPAAAKMPTAVGCMFLLLYYRRVRAHLGIKSGQRGRGKLLAKRCIIS
eukprot:COSAG01_NODE_1940_length_8843_cov_65.051235_1_plen_116_part_00